MHKQIHGKQTDDRSKTRVIIDKSQKGIHRQRRSKHRRRKSLKPVVVTERRIVRLHKEADPYLWSRTNRSRDYQRKLILTCGAAQTGRETTKGSGSSLVKPQESLLKALQSPRNAAIVGQAH